MDRKSLAGEVLPEHSQFCAWVLATPDPSSGNEFAITLLSIPPPGTVVNPTGRYTIASSELE